MAVYSIINYDELGSSLRLDAQFYQPRYLKAYDNLRRCGLQLQRLGSLCNKVTDGSHITPEYQEEGVPFLMVRNVHEQNISFEETRFITPEFDRQLKNCKPNAGDVLLTKVGTIGIAAVVPDDAPLFNIFVSLAVIKEVQGVDKYYLSAFLNSYYGRIQAYRQAKGISQPDLHLEEIREFIIPVPNKNLQKQVSELVETSISKKEQSKALYAEAENLLLRELHLDTLDLSHQLTYERNFSETVEAQRWDADYFLPKYVKNVTRLRHIPHSTMAEIADFSNGATPLGADYLNEGIPFLRIQNVNANRLELDDVVYISESIHQTALKRSQLKPRDVLITITGRIGTAAVIPSDLHAANMNQHSVRLRLRDKETNPYFLAAFLNSLPGLLQTERESYGTTRDALPYGCLRRILIPRAPQILQQAVEDTIHAAEAAREEAKHLLEKAKKRVEEMILGGA